LSMVLGLTTASPRGSVALWRDGEVVAAEHYEDEMRHAERLFAVVRSVMRVAGVERADIDALSCDVGPGSFTGVRVGVASAKGMALALERPLYPVGSLEAMAAAAFEVAGPEVEQIAPLLDAKRGEIFVAIYDRSGAESRPASHVPAGETLAHLGPAAQQPALRFCGRAAAALGIAADRCVHTAASALPDAGWIARLGAARLAAGPAPELSLMEPAYLRPPDAKRPQLVASPFV